jgi:hypothetical protein
MRAFGAGRSHPRYLFENIVQRLIRNQGKEHLIQRPHMAAFALEVQGPGTDCLIHMPIKPLPIRGRVTAKQPPGQTSQQALPQVLPCTLPQISPEISAGGNGVVLHTLIHARLIGSG